MSLNQTPGRQQSSLPGVSVWHAGPSAPLRRESPPAITHLFFLVEVILIQRTDLSGLHNTSGVAVPSSTSSTECPSTSKASFLLYRTLRKVREGKEGLLLPPVTCEHSPIVTLFASSSFLGRFFLTCSSFPLMSKMFSFQAVIGDRSQSVKVLPVLSFMWLLFNVQQTTDRTFTPEIIGVNSP